MNETKSQKAIKYLIPENRVNNSYLCCPVRRQRKVHKQFKDFYFRREKENYFE